MQRSASRCGTWPRRQPWEGRRQDDESARGMAGGAARRRGSSVRETGAGIPTRGPDAAHPGSHLAAHAAALGSVGRPDRGGRPGGDAAGRGQRLPDRPGIGPLRRLRAAATGPGGWGAGEAAPGDYLLALAEAVPWGGLLATVACVVAAYAVTRPLARATARLAASARGGV